MSKKSKKLNKNWEGSKEQLERVAKIFARQFGVKESDSAVYFAIDVYLESHPLLNGTKLKTRIKQIRIRENKKCQEI